jgi:hypothetical protein
MKVKLLLFGEAVTIPKTSKGLGVTMVSVWVDNTGFESASNDLGSLGYAFIETPEVDLGNVNADTASVFSNLHGTVVSYNIKSNTFVKSGGIVRVKMTVATQSGGGLVEKSIEFQADNCTGICVVTDPISFSCEMLQSSTQVAASDQVLSNDDIVALQDSAPSDEAERATA